MTKKEQKEMREELDKLSDELDECKYNLMDAAIKFTAAGNKKHEREEYWWNKPDMAREDCRDDVFMR